jgi:phytoene/squalene synthetase
MNSTNSNLKLASSITRAASKQTYYTIGFLVDRERVAEAYFAYAYFRWVDDALDTGANSSREQSDFLERQKLLLENCYRGASVGDVSAEEQMLVELIRSDTNKNSGLQSYIRNMMAVMAFDVERRGKLISQSELNEYTGHLAGAVTEAMHYFIGHCCYSPKNETRYLAVTAAHITHMLRDTFDDLQAGYFNIPRETLEVSGILPQDVQSDAYREWVCGRVQLARSYFKAGREYLDQVENPRCKLAGLAYTARFECVLDLIEQDGYLLRAAYPERKGLGPIVRAGGSILPSLFLRHGILSMFKPAPVHRRVSR